jgi:hypothetical protein
MASEHLKAFHERSFRDSLSCWQSSERRAALEMSEEEAAYGALEHAAFWHRMIQLSSTEDQVMSALATLGEGTPADVLNRREDKERLIRAACRFASAFALPGHFFLILEADDPEPEEIEEVEQVLAQIDGLDAVVDLSAKLIRSALHQDEEVLADLTRSRCVVAALVQRLSIRPDLAAVASRFLLSQRRPWYLGDGRPADWFTRLRELDRGYLESSLADLAHRPASSADGPPSVIFFKALGPALSEYDARSAPLGMAAAGPADQQSTRTQAELARRDFEIEGDVAVLVRLRLLFPPTRPQPALEVLLEQREAGGEDAISVYERFEVFIAGLSGPLSHRFDYDVNTVDLDDQMLEALRAADGAVGIVLITKSGEQRPVRPRELS